MPRLVWTLASLMSISFLTGTAVADDLPTDAYTRINGFAHQSRSATIARHGIVATSHPLASQTGLDVLMAGGNAADAAIAANAMLGVVEPMSCGIGGDLFVLYWDAKTARLYGLNASGRSPKRLTRQVFADRGLDEIPLDGSLSWSVPGCVDGWETLRDRFGTKSLSELLQPSIDAATEGAPVTQVIAGYWKGAEAALKTHESSAATFLLDGRAPREGELFRNPDLAATYRRIAEQGVADFYKRETAGKLVAFSDAEGGFFSKEDLAEHRSEWVEPISTNYRGYDVWELPPNGQGIAALQMLNILEAYDLKSLGRHNPQFWHLLVEAKKLAFADRARFYADPAFGDIPLKWLISKEYAEQRRSLISADHAAVGVAAGDPRLSMGDTIYLSVVDKDRNCCSLIQSNFHGFGSKLVPEGLGFAMQNRGALFALDGEHPNRLEPAKRPFHTIIPAMVTKAGRPWFCFGVMGGDMQPQGHVQVLVNLVDFGMNVQHAGDAARFEHTGSASPTGRPEAASGGTIELEHGVPESVAEALRRKGHTVTRAFNGGGYQGILIDEANGTLHGATEARKDGVAAGY
ncbi:MAG: gamma-glutamyltransferase [Planctomycetaceae bacterium]|nr:gamma-glutamyltransferase [Planctomycetaceae bacterium]